LQKLVERKESMAMLSLSDYKGCIVFGFYSRKWNCSAILT